MRKFKKTLSVILSLALCGSLVAPALAAEYNINEGSVTITSQGNDVYVTHGEKEAVVDNDKIVIKGSSGEATTNTIKVEDNVTAGITLDNVNIGGTSNVESSALSIGEGSDVTVNLVGDNVLNGYGGHAGLELNNSSVTIVGTGTGEGAATLTAIGNDGGDDKGASGIGGDNIASGSITIKNSIILEAKGTGAGAGIGGGTGEMIGNIKIEGSKVTAVGAVTKDGGGAGIGGGTGHMSGNITITDSEIAGAHGGGGSNASGIGAGSGGMSGNITITNTTADAYDCVIRGGDQGTGIGGTTGNIVIDGGKLQVEGGASGVGGTGDITIKDANVTAKTREDWEQGGSGISGGGSITITNSTVTAIGGNSGAGIGGGKDKTTGNITIIGGNVTATSVNGASIGEADGDIRAQLEAAQPTQTFMFRLDEDHTYLVELSGVEGGITFDEKAGTMGRVTIKAGCTVTLLDENFEPTSEVYTLGGTIDWATGRFTPKSAKSGSPDISNDGEAETQIDDVAVPLAGLFTRADAIGYLWEKSGSPEWALSGFPDVPEDHQWAVAIGWAQDMGIAVADKDGNFRPDDLVLRSVEDLELSPEGELEQFLNRYAVYAGIELDEGELFFALDGEWDEIIMGEDAQVIFNNFFARLELALAEQAA